ncbi:MAG: LTA synthase family protein [Acidobacteriota bacterium]
MRHLEGIATNRVADGAGPERRPGTGSRAARGATAPVLAVVLALAAAPAAAGPPLAWQPVELRAPHLMWVGLPVDVPVTVRNVGTETWSEARGDHLSYHWLSADGQVAERDGARAILAAPVPPGATADLVARVVGPPAAGRWTLVWEMVREDVRWYGPSTGGPSNRIWVWSVRRSTVLQISFLVVTIGGLLAMRRWRAGSARDAVADAVPMIWTWAGVVLVCLTFAELVDRPLWQGAMTLVASGAALFALPVALVPGRARRWMAFSIVAMLTAVAVADLVYMRYFGNIIPVVAVLGARQVGRVEGSIVALLHGTDLWLLPAPLAGLLLALRGPAVDPPGGRRRSLGVAGALVGICLLAALPAGRAIRAALQDPSTTRQVFSQQSLIGQWGVANLHLLNAASTLRDALDRGPLSAAERERVVAFFRAQAAAAPGEATGFAVAHGANLLLIQVESLQEWAVGAVIGGHPVMPTLAALRHRGLYFSAVFDQTGEGRSSDGEFAALNSLHPLPEGAVAFRCAHNHFVALPGILRRAGYTTLSAHPFERGFWNRAILHPAYGFSHSMFRSELGPGETIGWGLADGAFFTRMEPELERLPRPFFAFLITLGLHHPFDAFPDRHKDLDVGDLRNTPLGNYLSAMHYFDESLKQLLDTLAADGLLDDTVVALYGDHEAGFSIDQRIVDLAGIGPWDPSYTLRIRRVPFLVLLPHDAISAEIPVVGGHVDIAPTLLFLLGLPRPGNFLGSVLYPGRDAVAAMWDGSVVAPDRLFLTQGPRIPPEGACFAYPVPSPLPRDACRRAVARGAEELRVSQEVLEHDLVPDIASALR